VAWLNTAPTDAKGKIAEKTRIEVRRERGDPIPLPDVAFTYLTEWLFEIGPTVGGGMGAGPVGYRDILAWREITGIVLMPWEAKIIRHLSGAYLAFQNKASAHDCPMPFVGTAADITDARQSVDCKIRAAFGSLKKAET
jgi:hypothetical protein